MSAYMARSARFRRMKITVGAFVDRARADLEAGGRRVELLMVGLTFRTREEFEASPGAVSDYVERVSRWLERRGIVHGCAWVLEMQQRGVPHYHVLWLLPKGQRLPFADRTPKGCKRPHWSHGSSNTIPARSHGYIVKYATKGDTGHPLPPRHRIFGVGGSSRVWRSYARWSALPRYCRDRSEPGAPVHRAPGGGWVDRSTGEAWASEWLFSIEVRGELVAARLVRRPPDALGGSG